MALARADGTKDRFYSMSSQIETESAGRLLANGTAVVPEKFTMPRTMRSAELRLSISGKPPCTSRSISFGQPSPGAPEDLNFVGDQKRVNEIAVEQRHTDDDRPSGGRISSTINGRCIWKLLPAPPNKNGDPPTRTGRRKQSYQSAATPSPPSAQQAERANSK